VDSKVLGFPGLENFVQIYINGPQTPGKQTEKIFHVHYLEQNEKEFSSNA